ncbi:uncharacterized protein LOC124887259 isoform X1 [Capsicum annuum]|uniref:uncharacterized protein LOC124887259 isoform X1 n=1 Tax=Capsicum annuum TaxID=4072 RepID=UPI001FB15826|nr:uncharacterized protein LOC124887259 isoform X1 [Capsicum annuum]
MDCIFSSFLLKICSPLPKKLRSSRRGPCIQKTTTNNNKNISSEIPQMRSTCMEKVEGTLSHGCREAVSKRLSARVQQIQLHRVSETLRVPTNPGCTGPWQGVSAIAPRIIQGFTQFDGSRRSFLQVHHG